MSCYAVGLVAKKLTSLLPRPKPLTTGPSSFSGNGASGPVSEPMREGRGSVCFIFVTVVAC